MSDINDTKTDTQKDIMRYLLEQVKAKHLDKAQALSYLKYLEGAAKPRGDDIAIIGLACRFPDANNKTQYWDNLAQGRSSIGPFPDSRKADLAALDDSLSSLFNGGFLSDIRGFDNEYFNIPPAVASHMDPYHRLLLESFIETIEDAGYSRTEMYGKNIGVYTGNDHTHRLFNSYLNFIDEPDFNSITGSWTAVLASRIAYLLNFQGPALVVDTSCSSALVAIDIAVKALRDGDCDAALVGAANLFFAPGKGIVGDVENDDFVVRAFDQGASGTVWGEGVASLLLKPLSTAIKDGDDIYGVIQGIAVNNDGASNGITAPSAKAQEQVLNKAWKRAGISPEELSYVESHGTGTHLGDPIEVRGLTNAISKHSKRKQFCGLGSVKTNIGHTVGTAGLASFIKVLLSYKNEKIPPSLNFNAPNPLIDFCQSPVFINDTLTKWPALTNEHRYAGISSFSLSGTNCHVVLRDYQSTTNVGPSRPMMFLLSGRSPELLRETLSNHIAHFKNNNVDFSRACFTAAVGREHHGYRVACVVKDINDLLEKLERAKSYLNNGVPINSPEGKVDFDLWCSEALTAKPASLTTLEKTALDIIQSNPLNAYDKLASCYVSGARINWKPLFTAEESLRTHLPAQPWQHTSFWLTPSRRENKSVASNEDATIKAKLEWIVTQPSRVSGLGESGGRTDVSEKTIAWIIADTLGYERLEPDNDYYALGGDSILGAKIVHLINSALDADIQVSDLMSATTIGSFIKASAHPAPNSPNINRDIPLVAAGLETAFELSRAQERMLILSNLVAAPCAYNVNALLEIDAIPDIEHTRKVVTLLLQRHEILRTGYRIQAGRSAQFILPTEEVMPHVEISTLPENANSNDVAQWLNGVITPFNLEQPPLLRVFFAATPSHNQCYMVLDMHHIATDGASMGVLVADFIKLASGQQLAPLSIQYKDYAAWHNSLLSSSKFAEHAEYWRNQYAIPVPDSSLPLDYPRPAVQQFEGERTHHRLPPTLLLKAKKIAAEQGVSLYMLLNAVFRILLFKYQVGTDLVIGSPVTGRNHAQLNNLVGMFVNTLAMRFNIEPAESFEECVNRLKHSILEDFSHQDYPFEALIEDLDLGRNTARNPLFDVYFVLQNEDMGLSDSGVKVIPHDTKTSKFDLTVIFREEHNDAGASLIGDWEYSTALFKASTISRLANHFERLLDQVCTSPKSTVHDLSLLNEEEKHYQLVELNQNKTNYPSNLGLGTLFEQQVNINPRKVALRHISAANVDDVTYEQLNIKANQLANYLCQHPIQPNAVVALYLPRSIDMVVAILAALKSGFIYVPLDAENPIDRINEIIADSEAETVITLSTMMPATTALPIITLDTLSLTDYSSENTTCVTDGESIAYLMYTSGTTGKPKGTIIRHKSIARVVIDTNYLQLDANDICLQLSSFAFDGCVPDLFGALLNGGQLVLPDKEITLNLPLLAALLIEQKITSMFITTSLFNVMVDNILDSMKNVRNIIFGGEAASVNHVSKALSVLGPNRLINGYGPTETTVFAVAHVINHVDVRLGSIPIGKTLSNTTAYILDEELCPVPIGATAELYIGGDGVALGYLNREALTAERFVQNPHLPNDTLYRTGDLVKRLDDGCIQYIGRKDTQVKIRGFRIELGEIKTCITQYQTITDAAVTADLDASGAKQLVAWFVTQKPKLFDTDALRCYLHSKLPEYMVPVALIAVRELPLNINGKLDYHRLPRPEFVNKAYIAPSNETERKIAAIWEQVLAVPTIGIHENFFSLGGDSIKGIRLVAQLQQEGLSATIASLFEHPTIAGLANIVGESKAIKTIQVDQGPVTGELILNPIQRWFFDNHKNDVNHFNHSMWISVGEMPSSDKIKVALDHLITQHDLLRTRFTCNENGEWSAYIGEPSVGQYRIEEFIGTHWKLGEPDTTSALMSVQKNISIEEGILLSVGVFKTQDSSQHYLCIAIHHLVVDVVSWPTVLEDFDSLLSNGLKHNSQVTLPKKTMSFKDWNQALLDQPVSDNTMDTIAYWCAIANEDYLQLPEASGVSTLATSQLHVDQIDKYLTQTVLTNANNAYSTEPVHLLLCALTIALNRWFGKGKTLVQLEGHGRHPMASLNSGETVDRTVGWFTSIYPHILPAEDDDIASMIKDVKEGIRKVPDKGRDFGVQTYLSKTLSKDTKAQLNSIQPQIGFNFLGNNTMQNEEVTPLSRLITCSADTPQPLLLDLVVSTVNGNLQVETLFDSDRLEEAQVESFFQCFVTSLTKINNHCLDRAGTEKTASDFSGVIDQSELEDIFDDLELI
ncbi:amino acid adenylation domain-containing protein [Saccharophagus degradans]|uniref:non-ribosomal peptide synthetase n=1 Tax=Saccharophagus degradans TaxID=86304 RepID=UPI001C085C5B|nr:non-ribosomal peptide synthetase [Saccharophagus degradans]MBU2985626.1 amino acid adenylation domain-containing protein [Saccharophagus degradans]